VCVSVCENESMTILMILTDVRIECMSE
jgi:hypothetical protein